MSLFVTGSESFIGRVLLDRCAALGVEAVGVDAAAPDTTASKKADIRDLSLADLMPEGATVIHLAAISRDSDCRTNPALAFDVNVNGTLNVAAAAQKRAARQLVFASSEWVYGDVRNDGVQVEDQPIDVTTMKSEYALSKIVGEQLLKLTCKLPAVTVLRFGIVYGTRPSNWSAVENLFNAVRTQDEITIGAAATARRFIHVNDIADGLLASRGRTGFEIFNLSGDGLITLGDVVDASQTLLGRQVKVVESNPAQPSIRNPDNRKARANLAWKPEVGLVAGLADLNTFLESVSQE